MITLLTFASIYQTIISQFENAVALPPLGASDKEKFEARKIPMEQIEQALLIPLVETPADSYTDIPPI